ncbi:NAD-dependent epimerase/dehydratase family protein [Pelagicoccus sp. SDUM812002]|uniref:NAD-dependent epimerase/dehydratase family protein n=1 Tax=Pelagicoccus sp. SDUM812002 TaxID=3041266 RepID=UPI00280ECEED|nr:NAD-dependent epimerase/dehydratase family protein [Pelagicoccus sp. SDUM812002]MDQ8184115.1 GDP-mannose 4,6-dehydratase [Pelagicoccus sp. SDUM812002]
MKGEVSYEEGAVELLESRAGFCEWFRVGERARAERAVADLQRLGVRRLRFGVSWADYFREGGPAWYDWLIPFLASHLEILPCFTYTPPSLGIEPSTASPPRDPKAYADFMDTALDRYGEHFEWVELWNEPNNLNDWDFRLDPHWEIFSDMISKAAYWCQKRGYKTLMGGMAETNASWLAMIGDRGVLQHFDAIGVHGFPGTWDFVGFTWERNVENARETLHRYNPNAEVWVTEAGYSTWRHDEREQVNHLLEILRLPVERSYIYQLHDLHPDEPHQDGLREDVKHYHFGVKTAEGEPKLAFRLWEEGGVANLVDFARTMDRPFHIGRESGERPAVIFGGAGFVGTNVADRLCSAGTKVRIFDNLSRAGVEKNLAWLLNRYPEQVEIDLRDIRDPQAVKAAVADASCVFQLASQVAVTTSLLRPQEDFTVNACGTFNLLEALRTTNPVPLLFTSTNKVYGGLDSIPLKKQETRYTPESVKFEAFDESFPLNFCSPYGCSKGTADQYVLDYARSYGLPATVFRMSCIYGPHQWGTEDQGWVAHFINNALKGEPISIYGDGRQVRDVLYVDDLADAMAKAVDNIESISGEAFNVGGGVRSTLSLLELVDLLQENLGLKVELRFSDWRECDQRYYVSDTSKLESSLDWRPQVAPADGVRNLCEWLERNVRPRGRSFVAEKREQTFV